MLFSPKADFDTANNIGDCQTSFAYSKIATWSNNVYYMTVLVNFSHKSDLKDSKAEVH